MSEQEPEVGLANRENKKYWFIDSDLRIVKPGDIVMVSTVLGEKFGKYDGRDMLKAATFLGEYTGDEEASMALASLFLDPEEMDHLAPEQVDSLNRMPYFRAHFEGVGEVTFAGIECFWAINQEQ